MKPTAKLIKWEGDIYQIDLDVDRGFRVLIKEGSKFVSKPDLGKLGATILYEGIPLTDEEAAGLISDGGLSS